jgi:hypothetical protein
MAIADSSMGLLDFQKDSTQSKVEVVELIIELEELLTGL